MFAHSSGINTPFRVPPFQSPCRSLFQSTLQVQVPRPVSASASAASSGSGLGSGLVSVSSSPICRSLGCCCRCCLQWFSFCCSAASLLTLSLSLFHSLSLTLPVLPSRRAVNVAACAYEVDFSWTHIAAYLASAINGSYHLRCFVLRRTCYN